MSQFILTNLITAIALLFVVIAAIDFASGLAATWQAAGAKPQSAVESAPVIEQPIVAEVAIAPPVELTSLLPAPWLLPVSKPIALPQQQMNNLTLCRLKAGRFLAHRACRKPLCLYSHPPDGTRVVP